MKGKYSNYRFCLMITLIALSVNAFGQAEKKLVRQGNKKFEDAKYSDAELSYRRALGDDDGYADAVFNAGDALYKQEKYDDAAKQFQQNFEMSEDKAKKATAMYNRGNALLKANKLEESIEAYKNSLRIDPDNMEAKFNLAYVQDLLREQQQQQQQDQDQQQNQQDQQENQQDQQENQQDQQENQQDQDDQDQQNNNDQQDQQQDQQGSQISREDAERILNALANEEKDVQDKVNEEKAKKAVVVGSGKNW